MGFLDALFGGSSGPTPRKVAGQVAILESRHGEPARRYQAMEKLLAWGTAEAIEGLLARFKVTAEKEISDEEEKAWLAEALEKADRKLVLPAIQAYLRRETAVNWPLRVLRRTSSKETFCRVVTEVLAELDLLFDRQPERKVELIQALMDAAADPLVHEAVVRFLEDTDDAVRIAASELVAASGCPEHVTRLVDTLLDSADRPRVRAAICEALAAHDLSVSGRKAEVEPCLPEGFYLTRQGAVKRLGR